MRKRRRAVVAGHREPRRLQGSLCVGVAIRRRAGPVALPRADGRWPVSFGRALAPQIFTVSPAFSADGVPIVAAVRPIE